MRIASARMYSVNPAAASAWRTLLDWVIARAGVACEVVDYPAPQPLPALWSRPDLGCVFMCGYPLAGAARAPAVLAAPIPAGTAYAGRPVYWTNIVARRDGAVGALADAFGRRFAYTTPDSQSGYQAVREYLAPTARLRGAPLFASMVGPLVTPRRVIEAVLAGEADAGPVDSYAFDLMSAHEADLVAPLAVLATTAPTPIPPLVGAADMSDADAHRLTQALLAVADAPDLAGTRHALRLAGFAPATSADYAALRDASLAADAMGYRTLA